MGYEEVVGEGVVLEMEQTGVREGVREGEFGEGFLVVEVFGEGEEVEGAGGDEEDLLAHDLFGEDEIENTEFCLGEIFPQTEFADLSGVDVVEPQHGFAFERDAQKFGPRENPDPGDLPQEQHLHRMHHLDLPVLAHPQLYLVPVLLHS